MSEGVAEAYQNKIVLIADDEEYIRVHIARKLASRGLIVLEAGTGQEVLEMAEKNPHAILMDVKMPVIDGFEAARRLKASEKTRHIPLILLSARAQQQDVEEGYKAGADHYMTKPVTISQIMDILEKCLG